MTQKIDHQHFYKTMVVIGLPIAFSHLISSSLNLVDTFMIGGLGEQAIAGVGVANRWFFLLILSLFGIYSGCGIFASQYWGKRDLINIHKVMGISLMFGLSFAALFALSGFLVPGLIMRIFTDDGQTILLGSVYLRIVSLSYLITAVTFMYAFTARSVHKTTMPMIASVVAIITNTFLNYCLISGHFGFPALGVKGAAIATLISRCLEALLLIGAIYLAKTHPLKATLKDMFAFKGSMVKKIVKTGLPVFINEATWSLGNTVYFIAFGLLGTGALAVVQITYTVTELFQSLFMGIGSACSVMIGNAIGNQAYDQAYQEAKRFLRLTTILSLGIVGGLLLSRELVIGIYPSLALKTQDMLFATLTVAALYQVPKMFTFTMIVGILRSGGDTTFCMVLDMVTIWLVGVPLAFVSVMVLKWPIHMVIGAVFFEEIIKVGVTLPRFISKKWIQNLISED